MGEIARVEAIGIGGMGQRRTHLATTALSQISNISLTHESVDVAATVAASSSFAGSPVNMRERVGRGGRAVEEAPQVGEVEHLNAVDPDQLEVLIRLGIRSWTEAFECLGKTI